MRQRLLELQLHAVRAVQGYEGALNTKLLIRLVRDFRFSCKRTSGSLDEWLGDLTLIDAPWKIAGLKYVYQDESSSDLARW
jgi:hypothetical protein